MSRYYAAMREKSGWGAHLPPPLAQPVDPTPRAGEYFELIRRLFHSPSATAIIGSIPGEDVSGVCDAIAEELDAFGKRVIVVRVDLLLRMKAITVPDETAFTRRAGNVWLWPSSAAQRPEFPKSRPLEVVGNWLDFLRGKFDSVLLNCPGAEIASAVGLVAALADATVLVVEAGRTPKQQIQRSQRMLQMSGAKLAGCILIRRR